MEDVVAETVVVVVFDNVADVVADSPGVVAFAIAWSVFIFQKQHNRSWQHRYVQLTGFLKIYQRNNN